MPEHLKIFTDRMTPAEVAAELGINPQTLEKWRCTGRHGKNLPHYKIGRRVFYRRADVERFIELHRREHTGQEAVA